MRRDQTSYLVRNRRHLQPMPELNVTNKEEENEGRTDGSPGEGPAASPPLASPPLAQQTDNNSDS